VSIPWKHPTTRKKAVTEVQLHLSFYSSTPVTAKVTFQEDSKASVNFINILRAHFLYKMLAPKITKPNLSREKLQNLLSHKKQAHKKLIKLMPNKV